jgi:hypothetical protein
MRKLVYQFKTLALPSRQKSPTYYNNFYKTHHQYFFIKNRHNYSYMRIRCWRYSEACRSLHVQDSSRRLLQPVYMKNNIQHLDLLWYIIIVYGTISLPVQLVYFPVWLKMALHILFSTNNSTFTLLLYSFIVIHHIFKQKTKRRHLVKTLKATIPNW